MVGVHTKSRKHEDNKEHRKTQTIIKYKGITITERCGDKIVLIKIKKYIYLVN